MITNLLEKLPDLEETDLIFDTDEKIRLNDALLQIKHKDKVIWQENVLFEYYGIFHEICSALQEKYGTRFDSLNIKLTGYMVGDSYRASGILEAIPKCNVFW